MSLILGNLSNYCPHFYRKLNKIDKLKITSTKNSEKLETQGNILLKHENVLKDVVLNSALDVKFNLFRSEIEKKIEDQFEIFTIKFNTQIQEKVDSLIFYEKLKEKATKEQLNETNEQIKEFASKMELLNQFLEQKRRDEEENRNPVQRELDRLDNDKADKLEFFELKEKVEELKEIVDSFDDDEDDQWDEEDSVEEDVLSLAKGNDFISGQELEGEEDVFSSSNKTPLPFLNNENNQEMKEDSNKEFGQSNKVSEQSNHISEKSNTIIPEDKEVKNIIKDSKVRKISIDSKIQERKKESPNIDTQQEVHLEKDNSPLIKPVLMGLHSQDDTKRDNTPDPTLNREELHSVAQESQKQTPRAEKK